MNPIGAGAPPRDRALDSPVLHDARMTETLRQLESDITDVAVDASVSNANTWPYNALRSPAATPWPAPIGAALTAPSSTSTTPSSSPGSQRQRVPGRHRRNRLTAPVSSAFVALLPIRGFIALGWLRAAVEKVIEPRWWSGGQLDEFLVAQRSEALPFMPWLIDNGIAPAAPAIAVGVMFMQFTIAFGFVFRRTLRPALWAAIALSVTFIAMGVVTPSAFYLVIQLSLLAALDLGVLGEPGRTPRRSGVNVAASAALACLPFVETLHPARVITDPAVVLATIAAIAALTQLVGCRAAQATNPVSVLE